MDVDTVTDSISTMKLTEPPKKSHTEICCLINKVNFDIENTKQLLRTPEHKKDRSHYYFETTQLRLLQEKLRHLEENERNNAFGEYSKTKEFLDLKRSAAYWLEKLFKESISLKDKLGISGDIGLHSGRKIAKKKTITRCDRRIMLLEDSKKLYSKRLLSIGNPDD